jgi:hypothetical protein
MWASLAATVVLAGGAVGTRRLMAYLPCGAGVVGLEGGSFVCCRAEGPWTAVLLGDYKRSLPWWSYAEWPGGWSVDFSLWLPAGVSFAVTSLSAFMVYRRRPGYCPCGYDLLGLPASAPCPECGAEPK